jgi:NAD(P)-dependent dehydrogenase (short-subunit alcohol dehydrogenase family)
MAEHARVVLVTGSSDGIGLETARELARRGESVIVHGRDARRIARAAKEVASVAEVPQLEPVQADFSSLADVRALVAELERRELALDVLISNAGIFARQQQRSADGFELTFAVNHLAPFLLAHLLLESRAGRKLERIVFVSSMAHASGQIDLADPDGRRRAWDGYDAYASSKLANVLTAVELARRLAPRKIDVNSLEPGVVSTKLLRAGFGGGGPDSLEEGAATPVFLALDPSVRGTSGRYFSRKRATTPSSLARDGELCRRFYELSCQLVGARPIA